MVTHRLKASGPCPEAPWKLGETLQQGVVREVLEETGLTVAPLGLVELLDRIIQDEESGRVRYHYVLIDFACRATGGSPLAGSDADEVRWVERAALDQYGVAPITVRVIEKAFGVGQVRKRMSSDEVEAKQSVRRAVRIAASFC